MNYREKDIWYCHKLMCGDKIKFRSEKQKYTIKAKNDRFLICTKPFNLKHTVLYTIVDLERFVRGTNDRVFNPYDYTVQEDIDQCLVDLTNENEDLQVSHRNCIELDIDRERLGWGQTHYDERYPNMLGDAKPIHFGDVIRVFGGECYHGIYEYDHTLLIDSHDDITVLQEGEYLQIIK